MGQILRKCELNLVDYTIRAYILQRFFTNYFWTDRRNFYKVNTKKRQPTKHSVLRQNFYAKKTSGMFPTLYFALYCKYFTSTNNALPTIDKANNRILPYCLNTPLATYCKQSTFPTQLPYPFTTNNVRSWPWGEGGRGSGAVGAFYKLWHWKRLHIYHFQFSHRNEQPYLQGTLSGDCHGTRACTIRKTFLFQYLFFNRCLAITY